MKKTGLLLALFSGMVMGSAAAGSLTFYNFTACPFQVYNGVGSIANPVTGTPYTFSFGPMTLNTGTTPFTDPTLLPGFSTTAPANLQASGCVKGLRISRPEVPETYPGSAAVFVGNVPPYTTYTSVHSPACNGGNNYTITWNTGVNACDVVVLIF